ncbi:LppX_LprAFG lipoprotein [Plantactinospora sonchi]|uniref:LppX_LprAFG lipoprotein n=1 Tax=Plantactinospora sonchi TaxID=1544735 RepID=A0ABU7RZQ2_9ACTN
MRRSLALAGALSLLLALSAACTGDRAEAPGGAAESGPASLPEADGLLRTAADELRSVRSARFAVTTDGSATLLDIRSAEGVITAEGEAEGTARLSQAGEPLRLSFVVKGESLYVNGLTDGWQRLPLSVAATIYDPSALLSADRGIANLVATASGSTEARESVDGVPAYRIRGTLPGAALSTLAPGVDGDVVGTLWIGVDRPLLHRVTFPVPGGSGTVTVTFSDYDAPVTIRTPR